MDQEYSLSHSDGMENLECESLSCVVTKGYRMRLLQEQQTGAGDSVQGRREELSAS
jgi:hypothetical protein